MNKYKSNNPKTTPPSYAPRKNFGGKRKPRFNKGGFKKPVQKPKYNGPDLYLTNSYNLAVTVTPKQKLLETDWDKFREEGPFKDFPFFVVDRMRMKTVVSTVQVISDYERFTKMDHQTSKDIALRVFFGDDEAAYKSYMKLNSAVNWKTIGVTPDVDTDDNVITCFNENGDLITWYRDKADKPDKRMPGTNEWALIEKTDLVKVYSFINEKIIDSDKYWESISLRDELAIRYLKWICNSCSK